MFWLRSICFYCVESDFFFLFWLLNLSLRQKWKFLSVLTSLICLICSVLLKFWFILVFGWIRNWSEKCGFDFRFDLFLLKSEIDRFFSIVYVSDYQLVSNYQSDLLIFEFRFEFVSVGKLIVCFLLNFLLLCVSVWSLLRNHIHRKTCFLLLKKIWKSGFGFSASSQQVMVGNHWICLLPSFLFAWVPTELFLITVLLKE